MVSRYGIAVELIVLDERVTTWWWVTKSAGAEETQEIGTIKWSVSVLYRDKSGADRPLNTKGTIHLLIFIIL